MTIAIVGAGAAGLACAVSLAARGRVAHVFDKGRGPGGRCATRRLDWHGTPVTFDHGTPFVPAGHMAEWPVRLRDLLAPVMAPFPVGSEALTVATPTMSSLLKALDAQIGARFGVEVTGLARGADGWRLATGAEDGHGPYATLVVAVPAPQAARLLAPVAPDWAGRAAAVTMTPTVTAMALFERRLDLPDMVRGDRLALAVRDSAKPGRAADWDAWVIHGGASLSRALVDADKPAIAEAVLTAFLAETGIEPQTPLHLAGHTWRYARVSDPLGEPCLWDPDLSLGLAGDWCPGHGPDGGLTEALHSGTALAKALA